MNIRSIKNISLISIFIIYIFIYKFFVFTHFIKNPEIISASFLIGYVFLSVLLLGFRKDKSTILKGNIIRLVLLYLLGTFILMYGIGFFVGFLKNSYSLSFGTMLNNLIGPLLIVVLIELFRYIVIWANKDKLIYIIIYTLIITLFEIITSVRVFDFSDASVSFRIIAVIILPIIVKNILLSYLCYHVGYKSPLLYRLVMDLYIFIVPIIPDIGEYVTSMVLISLPILLFIGSSSLIDDKNQESKEIIKKEDFSVWDIPVTLLLIIMIYLISGFFPHYMIGIGSDSMKPTINRGDAIILKKVDSNTELKEGDIIAYRKDNITIVHRIDNLTTKNGKIVYTTKGDANNGVDINIVERSQIKGIVKFKIPLIAYPTVWLNELIHRGGVTNA